MDLNVVPRAFKHQVSESHDETVVVLMSEFGRAASENSIQGLDHGWASAIFSVAGLLKVKQVLSVLAGFRFESLLVRAGFLKEQ